MIPRSAPRSHYPLVLVLVIAALIKLFFMDAGRSFEVHDTALEWIRSGEFKYHHLGAWNHTFQFPVYTAIVALFYLLGLGKTAVLVFQLACGTASAYLVYRTALVILAGRSYERAVAIGVAALTGLSPFLAYYQVRMLHPFAWDMFLAMALFHLSWTTRTDRPWRLLGLFSLAGLVLLDRPTLAVFMLPFFWRERHYLIRLRNMGLKLILLLVMIAPLGLWSIRNHAVTGRFELNSVSDQIIWMGIQEATQGSGLLPNGDTYAELLTVPERRHLATLYPAGQSAFFKAKWQAEVHKRPWLWWKMLAVKLKNFWLFRSNAGMDHSLAGMFWAILLYKIYAMVLFAIVLCAAWSRNTQVRITLLTVLCLSVAQCVFYFETRHRLLVEPLLMLIAAAAIGDAYESWRGLRTTRTSSGGQALK